MNRIDLEGSIIQSAFRHKVEYDHSGFNSRTLFLSLLPDKSHAVPIFIDQIDEVIEMLQRAKKAIEALEPDE